MSGIIDITFKSNSEHEHFHIGNAFRQMRYLMDHHIAHVERHGFIRLGGKRNKIRFEIMCSCKPRKIERIDENAMSADTRTGIERHEAEWLCRCRIDDF